MAQGDDLGEFGSVRPRSTKPILTATFSRSSTAELLTRGWPGRGGSRVATGIETLRAAAAQVIAGAG